MPPLRCSGNTYRRSKMITEFLKRLPLFAGLDEQSLTWLVDNAETVLVQAGELLMEEGDPADGLYVTLDGDFEIMKRSGKQDVLLAVRGAGEMIGEMSLLEGGTRGASVRAIRDCRL